MAVREEFLEKIGSFDSNALADGRLSDAVFAFVEVNPVESESGIARIRADLWAMVTDETVPELTAYGALLGVTTIDRRQRNLSRFVEVMTDPLTVRRFVSLDAFQMLTAESYLYDAMMGRTGLLNQARSQCRRLMPGFAHHHGAQNLLVEIDLAILATDPTNAEILREAQEANDESIRWSPRPSAKYIAHRGLLFAYAGDEARAMADIQLAISTEASDRWDYAARIARYEAMSAQIQSTCSRRRLEAKLEAAEEDIDSSRGQLLTLTGLLAAVVAIVVINAGIATSVEDKADAVSLILMGTGSVVLAFSLLIGLVMPPRQNRRSFLFASAAVGLAMLALGYFAPVQ